MQQKQIKESCFDCLGDDMYVSTEEKWLKNRIMRFMQQYPDCVKILKTPDENDGCLYCIIPSAWLKISPPRKISEQYKQKLAQSLKTARQVKDGTT